MHLDKSCLLPGVCRLRLGAAAPIRTPCPNRISAFEKAARCCGENPAETVTTPVFGTTFDSLGEAYEVISTRGNRGELLDFMIEVLPF